MYKWIVIFFLFPVAVSAQDKLIFTNGSVKTGIVLSMTREQVYFRTTDTSQVQAISKSDLLLVENYKGIRYIFTKEPDKIQEPAPEKIVVKRNSLGVQPLGLLTGRATLVYERFTADDRIGFVFPLSLTFDPSGLIYNSRGDTAFGSIKRMRGVSFIGGADVNFYFSRNEPAFFIGPRFRYGTDVFLLGIEAYTLQTQIGFRFGGPGSAFLQHLSLGFGFARILSSPGSRQINSKESYGWYSINYRLGIRW